jgi:hypothetical protein
LIIGLVLLPLLPALQKARRSLILLAVFAAGFPLAVASRGDIAPWQVLVAFACGAVGAGIALWRPRIGLRDSRWRLAAVGVAGVALAAAVWPPTHSYLDGRYENWGFKSQGMKTAYEFIGEKQDVAVATTLNLMYPLYGEDLSNRVGYLGVPAGHGAFRKPRGCAELMDALSTGRYRYLVTSTGGRGGSSPTERMMRGVEGLKLRIEDYRVAVYELTGPVDSSSCPASTSSLTATRD